MSNPERTAWYSMIQRCENESNSAYHRYGGRGIRICKGWRQSIESFLTDMGPKPTPEHSIDRKNNDGGYWCGKCDECVANGWIANCRWATVEEQQSNKKAEGYQSLAAATIGVLQISDPDAFRRRVRGALVEAEGSVVRAASLLGIAARTMFRWIGRDPSLTEGIAMVTRGWPKGKPRKPHVTPKISG